MSIAIIGIVVLAVFMTFMSIVNIVNSTEAAIEEKSKAIVMTADSV